MKSAYNFNRISNLGIAFLLFAAALNMLSFSWAFELISAAWLIIVSGQIYAVWIEKKRQLFDFAILLWLLIIPLAFLFKDEEWLHNDYLKVLVVSVLIFSVYSYFYSKIEVSAVPKNKWLEWIPNVLFIIAILSKIAHIPFSNELLIVALIVKSIFMACINLFPEKVFE